MKEKREKGITLIALVVTIIILLILAGVAINMALGDNGLFKKSKEAVNTWKSAEENETDVLGEAFNYISGEMEGDKKKEKVIYINDTWYNEEFTIETKEKYWTADLCGKICELSSACNGGFPIVDGEEIVFVAPGGGTSSLEKNDMRVRIGEPIDFNCVYEIK